MIPLSFALAYAGFAGLCLAMDRHQRDLFGRRRAAGRSAGLRWAGWLLLGLSLPPCVLAAGWGIGSVLWCGLLTLAAGLLVLLMPYAPRLLALPPLLALAGLPLA
ncbi:DUF3325 domain-containing protein [Teichococcus aerofrigidensis]